MPIKGKGAANASKVQVGGNHYRDVEKVKRICDPIIAIGYPDAPR